MPILDDDLVRMCPSDMIGLDNRCTKGVILGQKVLRETGPSGNFFYEDAALKYCIVIFHDSTQCHTTDGITADFLH